jgi:hypothetical protein
VNLNKSTENNIHGWNMKLWLWVLLCSVAIFSTVPVARSFQKFIYASIGKEFFTYTVVFVVVAGLTALLYFFIFHLKVKRVSQYIWLFICGGLYIYFAIMLRQYPEEAIHLLEYGLLSFFVFKALSYRIHDRTVYITTVLFVLFVGTMDEFIQWMMPTRYWGLKDVWINGLAGLVFIIAVWKGIVPKKICAPARKISVEMLTGTITLNLIFLGLCLSNTPDAVKRYTAVFNNLSWLRSEESMTEYGYKYRDPEIGAFFSRFTLKELSGIDSNSGEIFGKIVFKEYNADDMYEKLIEIHTPFTNPFLYEFLIHVSRRDKKIKELAEAENSEEKIESSNIAFRENLLVEKHFGNTLKHTNFVWSDKEAGHLKEAASLWTEDYSSGAGDIITAFSLKGAWLFITAMLVVVWISAEIWKRRLNDG